MLHFFVRQMLLRLKEAITYFMVVIMKEDDYMMRNFYGKYFMTYVELNIGKGLLITRYFFTIIMKLSKIFYDFKIFWILYLISELTYQRLFKVSRSRHILLSKDNFAFIEDYLQSFA